jgi:hypothetical protein
MEISNLNKKGGFFFVGCQSPVNGDFPINNIHAKFRENLKSTTPFFFIPNIMEIILA